MSKERFTREYFLSELSQFHKWLGERSFWEGDKPGNAMRGLLYVYANADGLFDRDMAAMRITCDEYDIRLRIAIQHGLYKPKEESEEEQDEHSSSRCISKNMEDGS